jgi:hypothetical protein
MCTNVLLFYYFFLSHSHNFLPLSLSLSQSSSSPATPLNVLLSPESKLAVAAIKFPVENAGMSEGPSNRSVSTKPRFPNPAPPVTTIQARQAKKPVTN